ncbi:BCS1 N terminal-domain-containing protein [Aspergillus carlsbadensis]|nr:BCS1 N terminal-domain-containing protein [Aspergillus carlsbadensis]
MDFSNNNNLLYFSSVAVGSFLVKTLVDQYSNVPFDYIYASIEVYSYDEAYNYLMYWLMKQRFDRNKHRLIASTSLTSGLDWWARDDENDVDPDDEEDENSELAALAAECTEAVSNTRPLLWTPSSGTHYFKYNGRWLALTREVEERGAQWMSRTEKLRVSCLGWDTAILKQLMAEARLTFSQKENGKTVIYRGTMGPYGDEWVWTRTTSRPARPLSTVYLDESHKRDFLADVQRYLLPSTRKWYSDRGIPYRRGYMFYGPPGTGKSSLAFAAAGYLRLNVYILSLGSRRLTEDGCIQMFQKLPRKCLVLLEDVDSYDIAGKRKNSKEEEKESNKDDIETKNEMTLSALLNLLDGVAAQEGRVLIMTTNHLELLDPALVRPGRVDYKILFKLADRDLTQKMFCNFFSDAPTDQRGLQDEKGLGGDDPKLQALSDAFADKIPENSFSPADIQGYLLQNSSAPEVAIAGAAEWVVKRLEEIRIQAEEEAKAKKAAKEKAKRDAEKKAKEAKDDAEDDSKDEAKDDAKEDAEKKSEDGANGDANGDTKEDAAKQSSEENSKKGDEKKEGEKPNGQINGQINGTAATK